MGVGLRDLSFERRSGARDEIVGALYQLAKRAKSMRQSQNEVFPINGTTIALSVQPMQSVKGNTIVGVAAVDPYGSVLDDEMIADLNDMLRPKHIVARR